MATSRVALPLRLQGGAVDYFGNGYWMIWLHTNDHIHGTYLLLHPDGAVHRITVRDEEGDEIVLIKPAEGTE